MVELLVEWITTQKIWLNKLEESESLGFKSPVMVAFQIQDPNMTPDPTKAVSK